MFKKRTSEEESLKPDRAQERPEGDPKESPTPVKRAASKADPGGVNTILKGSRVIGDINVTCDLELSGDVEGNITSRDNANILIKGTCKGNIDGGNVHIQGELLGGNITAGNDVRISGKFKGGEVTAGGRIHLNGQFSGKLMGNEIEIGPDARGEGELLYRASISVAKGAMIEARISRAQPAQERRSPSRELPSSHPVNLVPAEKDPRSDGKGLKQALPV